MAYSTSGDPHWNGTAGEKFVADFIEKKKRLATILDPRYRGKVVHQGGTTTAVDLVYGSSNISVKTKTSSSGTTDWINSPAAKVLPGCREIQPVLNHIRRIRHSHAGTRKTREQAKGIMDRERNALNLLTDTALDRLSNNPTSLRNFLLQLYRTRMGGMDIIFNLTKGKKILQFKGAEHLLGDYLGQKGGTFFLMKQRSNSYQSRFIMFRDRKGNEHRTTLRLRLVTNNGMGALLAGQKWSSNKDSILTVKVQQEDHSGLFDYLDRKNELNVFPY